MQRINVEALIQSMAKPEAQKMPLSRLNFSMMNMNKRRLYVGLYIRGGASKLPGQEDR